MSADQKKESGGFVQWVKGKINHPSTLPAKGPEETILKNIFEANIEQLPRMNRESESPSTNQGDQISTRNLSPNEKPSVFHIVIPIDIQALFNPQWTSRALDRNMYERLRSYNNIQKPDRASTNKGEQPKNPQSAKKQRVIVTAFPIYGRVTASPEGGVTFDEPEHTTNNITEDYDVEFFGIKHKAYSTKEKDPQIKVVESKTYGWFKVAGESMNLATPTRIDNGDYVLFFMNNDPEACEKKIVIATQPSLDVQLPIVKRFIASPSRSKQSGNIQKKFYFHSESSRNKFRNDIEFTEEHRLIGEVIAVAKPVK